MIINENPLINKHEKNPSIGTPWLIFHFESLTKSKEWVQVGTKHYVIQLRMITVFLQRHQVR